MDYYTAGDDARARCRGILHIVQKGDTLYKIAKQYGVPLSRVMYANPYVDVYNLQIGDEICVPVASRPPCNCRPGAGNRPGMRPPMPGNRPGCICPPGFGNRPGMGRPTSENRPDAFPSESGESPEMLPSESGNRTDIRPGDEMTSRQPWDRERIPAQEDDLSAPSGQQGNSFPSVEIGREENSYPSANNDMLRHMRDDMQDGMPGNMRNIDRNIQNDMRSDTNGNIPGNDMQSSTRGNMQDDKMDNGQSSFTDPWMAEGNCNDFGCPSAREQMENRMPWQNHMNSDRMMDEYLMGMPRMENQK